MLILEKRRCSPKSFLQEYHRIRRGGGHFAALATLIGAGLLGGCGGGGGGGSSGDAPVNQPPVVVPDPVPSALPPVVAVPAPASSPAWLNGALIYNIYPEIFSAGGNFAGISAQLPRLHELGVNVIWLMPISPIAQGNNNGHPNVGSPYAIRDHTAINPAYGDAAELKRLVASAHALGMKLILDMPLNHTSWDNPLLTRHPEFYLHSDGNPNNVASIQQAFSFTDVAQLNYQWRVGGVLQTGLQTYMTDMLKNWISEFDIDGFRFDMPDNPAGDNRMIPASFWQGLRPQLEAIKPGLLMLGEEQNKALSTTPFQLNYGWRLQSELIKAALVGPAGISAAWKEQQDGWPAGSMHMTILQDWDLDSDLKLYGSSAGVMAAAAFNFTMNGVPLLWNGEEVGNTNGSNNTHALIDWTGANAKAFTALYAGLISLRQSNSALQQGSVTWLTTSKPNQVLAYERADANGEFLVLINFSTTAAEGSLTSLPAGSASWTEQTPASAPFGASHVAPPKFKLAAYDFAIFRRSKT